MTLAATVAPLAAYAIVFQTLLYLSLPVRFRARLAPVVTGVIGAGITAAAGLVFGFERIGLTGLEPGIMSVWFLGSVFLTVGMVSLLVRDGRTRSRLADPRLADLGPGSTFIHVFIRIPIFTALIEEAFFRGVLHAALVTLYPAELAMWIGAGLFGVWHIGPGLDRARAIEKSGRSWAVHTAVIIVVTTVAGLFLVSLRVASGSIWAPAAVHAAVNMTSAVITRRLAARPSPTPI